MRKKPRCLYSLPKIWLSAFRYSIGRSTKDDFKSTFFSFLRFLDNPKKMVQDFWKIHLCKIYPGVLARLTPGDYIISASPTFLLEEPAALFHAKLIATEVDIQTGHLLNKNCKGEEKVARCMQLKLKLPFEEVYTDSTSDLPLLKVAQRGYIVRRGITRPFKPDQGHQS